jgi:hypothetical protein
MSRVEEIYEEALASLRKLQNNPQAKEEADRIEKHLENLRNYHINCKVKCCGACPAP